MNTISQRRARAIRVAVVAFLLAISCSVLYYCHATLNTTLVFTHLFYAPIILACLWWRSRGLVVAAFLAGMLLVSHHVFLSSPIGPDEYARAGMFLVIGSVVAFLSERITRRRRLLLEMGEHIQHLNAVLRGIRDVNQTIVREKRRDRLIRAVCERLADNCGFHGAWIVLTDQLPTSIEAAQKGFGEDVLSELVGLFQKGQLPSCCRRAEAESRIIVNENPSAACEGCPLANAYAGTAALSAKLEFEGRLYGYMGVSVPPQFARDEEENSLLKEIAGDIAFGLYAIEIEAAREKSERIVRAMLDSASDGILLADAETLRFVRTNTAMCRMLGYSQDELKEMSVRDIHPEEDLPRVVSNFEKQLRGEISLAADIPVKRKDGSIFPADINAALIELGGRPHLLGIFRDITDRKWADEVLRENEEKLRTLYDSSSDAIMLLDEKGFFDCNDATLRLFGCASREEFCSRHPVDFSPPTQPDGTDSMSYAGNKIAVALKEGNKRFEYLHRRLDGTNFPAEVLLDAMVLGGRKVLQARVYDITERKRAEEEKTKLEAQLRQSQKMEAIGQLAGGMAHDFRNQLQVIKGFGSMLLRHGQVADEGRGKMEEILAAADRSARLTGQLLAFSRREMLQPEIIDPAELIRDLQESLLQMIGEDIRLLVDLGCNPDCVNVDSGQFQQAIMNLAVNARDAMPQGGELAITIESIDLDARFVAPYDGAHAGKFVMVSVRDTGVGMDERTRSQVFEPFFTTKEVGKGTGLGLSMVYGFVKQSNGIITCDSEPGKGTTFRLYFPVVGTLVEQKGIPDDHGPVQRGTETILLVEDEDAVRHLVSASLKEAGYTVLQAAHPSDALAKLSKHQSPVDILITDVVMPGMDGVTLAEKVVELRPGIQVLYVSGYVGDELDRRGLEAIRDSILLKPFSPAQLLDRLSEMLQHRTEQ